MSAAREPVPVEVELDPALHERLRHADPGFGSCSGQLMAGLSRLMAELGLPAEPDLSVGAGPGAGLPVEVTVAGYAADRLAGSPPGPSTGRVPPGCPCARQPT